MKGFKDWTLKILGRIGKGIVSVSKFLYKHIFTVLVLSVLGVSAGIIGINAIAGVFTSAIIVEAVVAGLILGAAELLVYGAGKIRISQLKRKEKKLAKKLEKSNEQEELGHTVSDKKRYKILKQLNKVRYKLARASLTKTGKPMSLFEGRRFTANKKEKEIVDKYKFLKTKAEKLQVEGIENDYANFRFKWLKKRALDKAEKRYMEVAGNTQTTPYQWTKNIKNPIQGMEELKIEKTQINCHKAETFEKFKEYAKNDTLSHKPERYIRVTYSEGSNLISTSARFVNKEFKAKTSELLLREALVLSEEMGDVVFPIKFTIIDGNEKGKNVAIKTKEQLETLINTFAAKTNKKVKPVIEEELNQNMM